MAMPNRDVIDEIAERLTNFHINARLQRLPEMERRANEMEDEAEAQTALDHITKKGQVVPKHTNTSDFPQGLPSPRPGCRPCWERLIFNYSWFEELLKAQKKLALKEGNKDIAWRTEFLDLGIEVLLAESYQNWTVEQIKDDNIRCGPEAVFFMGLSHALRNDMAEVNGAESLLDDTKRHGRDFRDSEGLLSSIVQFIQFMR